MKRIRGFFSGIRERVARLTLRIGAIGFLVLLTLLLIVPDALQDLVGSFSWFVRVLVIVVVYGLTLLLYEVPVPKRFRFGRATPKVGNIDLGRDQGSTETSRPEPKSTMVSPSKAASQPVQMEDKSNDSEEADAEFWEFLESTAKDSEAADTEK